MKNILSFFVLIAFFTCDINLFSETNIREGDYSFIQGITYNNTVLDARFFSEVSKEHLEPYQYKIHAWAVKLKPIDIFSLSIGTLSNTGIWGRFNTIAPINLNPHKQPYIVQNRLTTSLPSIYSSLSDITIQAHVSTQILTLSSFISNFYNEKLSAGVGISIPFKSEEPKHPLFSAISGRWTFAWKTSVITPKSFETWYTDFPSFIESYFHAGVQELAVKMGRQTIILGAGISQSTIGRPNTFFRSEYTFNNAPFLLNSSIFLSDLNYLKHNGRFEQKTVFIAFNPQLKYNLYGSFVRSLHFGLSSNTECLNEQNTPSAVWLTSFSFSNEIELVFLTVLTTITLSDLVENQKSFFILQEDSTTTIQTKIIFRPWYLDMLTRTWTIKSEFKKEGALLNAPWDISLQVNSDFFFEALKENDLYIVFSNKITCDKITKGLFSNLTLEFSMKTTIREAIFFSHQDIVLNLNSQLQVTEKKLKKHSLDISVQINL